MTIPKPKNERVEVCCTNCNQRRCVRNGQFTLSKCADHQENTIEIVNGE